ncbi:hypothetical protein PHYSODRAFT_294508 [Phytophthora sojae]|uniref:Uncharacterized protein n=1 Tax=Phytophthora sojae (strain P6497) TaxID=1094619 RepID=G4YMT7_PHYSP|nr:hypothetical protein PHYSODRAFT_294508 [Phytophthora sojae]EGZ29282.1 hypothetical protein PHYSODRAFT_294508 [Phytophthora sojae]|eukprot:XP_009516557.1 hypothetical protein PHYSODRAFT_294508 [Phytophthora sojae]
MKVSGILAIAVNPDAKEFPLSLDTEEPLPYTHKVAVESAINPQLRTIRSYNLVKGRISAPTRREHIARGIRSIAADVFAEAAAGHGAVAVPETGAGGAPRDELVHEVQTEHEAGGDRGHGSGHGAGGGRGTDRGDESRRGAGSGHGAGRADESGRGAERGDKPGGGDRGGCGVGRGGVEHGAGREDGVRRGSGPGRESERGRGSGSNAGSGGECEVRDGSEAGSGAVPVWIPPVQIYDSPDDAKDLMNVFARVHGYALVKADRRNIVRSNCTE